MLYTEVQAGVIKKFAKLSFSMYIFFSKNLIYQAYAGL